MEQLSSRTSKRWMLPIILLAIVVFAIVCLVSRKGTTQPAERTITILATSDMHGNIYGYDYVDDEETDDGMARLYTYIQQVREENPNTILIDAGDEIQGTITTDEIYNQEPDRTHPVLAAMNLMGYDAMTIGNHEFNWGIDTLREIIAQADFPVLAANVWDENGELLTGKGYTIVERDGIRIAIIGVVTPEITRWDGGKQGVDDCSYTNMGDAVAETIEEIGDAADITIVSAHASLHSDYYDEDNIDAGAGIIEENPEIPILQLAHAHVTLNEEVGNTLVGAVRNNAVEIARFDLTFDAQNQLVDRRLSIVSMEDVEPSKELRELPAVAEAHEETIDYIHGKVLGTTTAEFTCGEDVNGVPRGYLEDNAIIDLINQVQLEASGADVSATALFNPSGTLPAGDVTYANVFDIYSYDNTLVRVRVTGKELLDYMEWSAAFYNQWQEGDTNVSVDLDTPGFLYDMFAGVDYEIDVSQPAGQRIRNVTYKGQPLTDDTELMLVVNNYRYSAVLKAENLVAGEQEWESSESVRTMIANYITEHSPVAPEVDNNWSLYIGDAKYDLP